MAVAVQSAVTPRGATVVTPIRRVRPSPVFGSMMWEYRFPSTIAER